MSEKCTCEIQPKLCALHGWREEAEPDEARCAAPPVEESGPALNADREIWRGKSADSLFIVQSDVEALGINCGGYVIVQPIRQWHAMAANMPAARTVPDPETRDLYPPEKFATVDWAKRFCELFGINSDKWLQVVAYWFAKANAHGQADLAAITSTQPFVHSTVPDLAGLEGLVLRYREQKKLTASTIEAVAWSLAADWLESELARVRQGKGK